MMKVYKNEDWLYDQYWIKNRSIPQIAKICGACNYTIHYWMKKLNISRRSKNEASRLALANHCQLSQEAKEWVSGELLGDGSLNSLSPYSARFEYTSKYEEYINYIASTLRYFGIEQIGKICKRSEKEGCLRYNYASRCYVEFLSIQKKWYPNGKKIVPKDIELTSLTCRQWYLGDGSLIKNKGSKNPSIVLYTCGFLISDVEWLVQQLNDLGFEVRRYSCNNSIYMSSYSAQDFLNYIGVCPVKSYQYKWGIL